MKLLLFFVLYNTLHALNPRIPWAQIKFKYVQVLPKKTDKMLRTHIFKGYKDSQELCSNFWEQWWKVLLSLRNNPAKIQRDNNISAVAKQIAIIIGPPNLYLAQGPIQSILARLGHGSLDPNRKRIDLEYTGDKRHCSMACEDKRPAIELWLTNQILLGIEEREKGPFKMECGEDEYAEIVDVPDLRELATGTALKASNMLMEVFPLYRGEADYPNKYPRTVGGTVKQCVCLKESNKRKSPVVSELAQCFEALQNFEEMMNFKRPRTEDVTSKREELDEMGEAMKLWGGQTCPLDRRRITAKPASSLCFDMDSTKPPIAWVPSVEARSPIASKWMIWDQMSLKDRTKLVLTFAVTPLLSLSVQSKGKG